MQTTNLNNKNKEATMISTFLYYMIYKTNYNYKSNRSLYLQIQSRKCI